MVEYSLHKLIIPWQVLQELDILKDNKSGTFSSSKQNKAQKYAYLCFLLANCSMSVVIWFKYLCNIL